MDERHIKLLKFLNNKKLKAETKYKIINEKYDDGSYKISTSFLNNLKLVELNIGCIKKSFGILKKMYTENSFDEKSCNSLPDKIINHLMKRLEIPRRSHDKRASKCERLMVKLNKNKYNVDGDEFGDEVDDGDGDGDEFGDGDGDGDEFGDGDGDEFGDKVGDDDDSLSECIKRTKYYLAKFTKELKEMKQSYDAKMDDREQQHSEYIIEMEKSFKDKIDAKERHIKKLQKYIFNTRIDKHIL